MLSAVGEQLHYQLTPSLRPVLEFLAGREHPVLTAAESYQCSTNTCRCHITVQCIRRSWLACGKHDMDRSVLEINGTQVCRRRKQIAFFGWLGNVVFQ